MIRFRNVSKTYETGSRAVRNLSLTINDGEFVFIAGRSGSGKSTVIKLITGELKATEGSIEVNGTNLLTIKKRDIPQYRRHLGIVFQDFRLLNDRNVYENIAFAQRVIGASNSDIRKNVADMLHLTGLSARYQNMPYELSGGEQQRTAIARALINRPDIILADEPTGNLDSKTTIEVMEMIVKMARKFNQTIILVTHDPEMKAFADRIITLKDGEIINDELRKGKNENEII